MRIHLIAIGGSIMHNLAMELAALGHHVTGSDDEIYDPAKSRLEKAGLLPDKMEWDETRINEDIDLVILGMHAHIDNPELKKAKELNLIIKSFPEFVSDHIQPKKKIVVTGSHGKTTTTSMIMHVLHKLSYDFDYLVGGIIDGFDRMVRLSTSATIAVIEGDEYLSSKLDKRPKMLHYQGNIVITTGVAWDHMNVFPTYDDYLDQFRTLYKDMSQDKVVIYATDDPYLESIVHESEGTFQSIAYRALPTDDQGAVIMNQDSYPVSVFGAHNMANMNAARLACEQIGVTAEQFMQAIADFEGAGKRLEKISDEPIVYRDFAHAPSKVKATTSAVIEKHVGEKILVVLELHTYSSLNKQFIPQYAGALDGATKAIVCFDPHAVAMKRLDPLSISDVKNAFGNPTLDVYDNVAGLREALSKEVKNYDVILLMSSGNFGVINIIELLEN